jgi:hypothetical protein
LLGLEPQSKAASASTSAAASARPAVDPAQQRQFLLKRLESIRTTFWSAPLPALRESLAQLQADDFPDIESVVRRLSIVAGHRDQIPRIINHKSFDGDFLSVFKEVLIAAPRDAAVAKERTLAAFGTAKVRKRGTKMIQLVERELPYLYDLESGWLKTLVGAQASKPRRATAPKQEHFVDNSSGGGLPWWAIFVGLAVLRGVVRMFQE